MANHHEDGGPSTFAVGGDERDDLFEALSDPHRRFTLRYLRAVEGTVSLDELTTELAAREADRPVSDRPVADGTAIEIRLHHRHLPKLDEVGFLEYDADDGTVTPADRTDEAQGALLLSSDD